MSLVLFRALKYQRPGSAPLLYFSPSLTWTKIFWCCGFNVRTNTNI